MSRGPRKLAGPRSSMRHPPELCWAKMGCRVLGQRLKPAGCRAPMICLPLGTGRGPKAYAGSGGSTCTRSVLTPAVQVGGLPGPWDPGGLGDVGCELFLRALYDPSATLSSLLERIPSRQEGRARLRSPWPPTGILLHRNPGSERLGGHPLSASPGRTYGCTE